MYIDINFHFIVIVNIVHSILSYPAEEKYLFFRFKFTILFNIISQDDIDMSCKNDSLYHKKVNNIHIYRQI